MLNFVFPQALDLVYQANFQNSGRRRCPTCFQSTLLSEVVQQLSNPGTILFSLRLLAQHLVTSQSRLIANEQSVSFPDVRRLVVIDRQSRRVEGIISLRDVARYFLS